MGGSKRSRSRVAGVNALFRAKETARSADARVLIDPFARLFIEQSPVVWAIRLLRFVIPPLQRLVWELQTVHCVRHASVDALVRRAINDGFTQIAIFGAGYDMRAARFATEARVFELDDAPTIGRKQRVLMESGAANSNVKRCAVDLMEGDLNVTGMLESAGFDRTQPSCFILEGIVHYLTQERLAALLQNLSAVASRRVVITFIEPAMVKRASSGFVRLVQLVREVPMLYFEADDLARLFAVHGMSQFQSWRYGDQVREFAPAAEGRRHGVSQVVGQADL